MNSRELSNVIEFEFYLERMAGPRVVLPADPSLTSVVGIVVTHLKVVRSSFAVRQLSQTAEELSVPITIVSRVEEFPIATLVTLGHRIGDNAVVPRTTVELDAHANGATVVAIG